MFDPEDPEAVDEMDKIPVDDAASDSGSSTHSIANSFWDTCQHSIVCEDPMLATPCPSDACLGRITHTCSPCSDMMISCLDFFIMIHDDSHPNYDYDYDYNLTMSFVHMSDAHQHGDSLKQIDAPALRVSTCQRCPRR